ncbi:hypothetical protein CEUSTIGMA_g9848.t1 [Chlamydomonas eustigma]|uniref:Uncharacterized protein n=1 Tax=Chlamydomonas eustigma TaxID=1157962 RepID=A0A250XHZ1_9CHLO|nr:hypothetical protein CEUSTIGMA_g9848.t1 [Chlamydomonas eustigma]|eukprot:GAX82420.1 hypothetical protein CEUSTIGMA_g9848.t1 [Chlamydomonas eustigma]
MLLRTSSPRHLIARGCSSPSAIRISTSPRFLASSRANPEDKSWGDLLKSAGNLAKDVLSKVTDTVGQALAPSQQPSTPRQTDQVRQSPNLSRQQQLPQLFGGGLLGRALGGVVASAINQIGQQIEQASRESSGAYESAASRIISSQKLKSYLGEVRVGPIISQSVSSSSINGQVTKSVNLVFPVYSAAGLTAQAQVVSKESNATARSSVVVRLPDGRSIQIEDRHSSGGQDESCNDTTQIIDVEFKEVK